MKLSKVFLLELIWEKKWLLCCSYNRDKNKMLPHLHVITKALDHLRKKYNFILLSDFSNEPEELKHVRYSKQLPFEKC